MLVFFLRRQFLGAACKGWDIKLHMKNFPPTSAGLQVSLGGILVVRIGTAYPKPTTFGQMSHHARQALRRMRKRPGARYAVERQADDHPNRQNPLRLRTPDEGIHPSVICGYAGVFRWIPSALWCIVGTAHP
ncbi:MAG: hypothetical protein DMG67_03365 [Acidobacteria bacterium]|nr:MAG: hypothetical protein DMG67_03365 [Acidobacteriota bacterium]